MKKAAAHDPTRFGMPVPEASGEKARISLSEIETLCAKAARGAGFPWGVAEEAGMAARWLAAHGLPGPELMARHLEAFDARAWYAVAPAIEGRTWRTREGGRMCPIAAGTALSDRAGLADGSGKEPLVLQGVASPALLLPFAGSAAERLGVPLRVEWSGVSVVAGHAGLVVLSGSEALEAPAADALTVVALPTRYTPRPQTSGRVVDLSVWRRLDRLALRVTVPASDRSRADAGAGTRDND